MRAKVPENKSSRERKFPGRSRKRKFQEANGPGSERGKVIKCESAKVNMYKMRKFDAKGFAFYTSPFRVNLSHFRIIQKSASSTPIHKVQLPNCYFVVIQLSKFIQNKCDVKH